MTRGELRQVSKELMSVLIAMIEVVQAKHPDVDGIGDLGLVLVVTDDSTKFVDLIFDAQRKDGKSPLSSKVGSAIAEMLVARKRSYDEALALLGKGGSL